MLKFLVNTKPVSVNALYSGRRFLTKIGKETKESMAWEIKSQIKGEKLFTGKVAVYLDFFFSSDRSDVDGCVKATLDTLSGLVYKDDRQVVELHVFKYIDKNNPRTEIEVREA